MKLVACIFARGGSKGIPNKNIRILGGKPLIAWSIEQALSLDTIDEVYVSTDSPEIAEIAQEFGANVPFLRPRHLAEDHSPEWLAWRHMLSFFKEKEGSIPDALLSVPTTSPLRFTEDIQRCIESFELGTTDAVITVTRSSRNPYFNMVELDEDGYGRLAGQSDIKISNRQEAPDLYDVTTVAYVADARFVINSDGIFEGRVKCVTVPRERAIDIDTQLDFEIADFLISKLSLNSNKRDTP